MDFLDHNSNNPLGLELEWYLEAPIDSSAIDGTELLLRRRPSHSTADPDLPKPISEIQLLENWLGLRQRKAYPAVNAGVVCEVREIHAWFPPAAHFSTLNTRPVREPTDPQQSGIWSCNTLVTRHGCSSPVACLQRNKFDVWCDLVHFGDTNEREAQTFFSFADRRRLPEASEHPSQVETAVEPTVFGQLGSAENARSCRRSTTLLRPWKPVEGGKQVKTDDDRKIVVPERVVQAVLSHQKIDEAPHCFYKYPARFSPIFAREMIKAFTSRGDTVLDPFCGGGTSLVEAISLGRRAAGFDVSSLAVFLTRAKTTSLSIHDKRRILEWAMIIESVEPRCTPSQPVALSDAAYYQRNLPEPAKTFFETILYWAELLSTSRQQNFIRMVLIGVGQWALDCKKSIPTWIELRVQFYMQLKEVLSGHYEHMSKAAITNKLPRCRLTQMRRVINRSSEESNEDGRVPEHWLPAKLVVTSPPYPGVHVMYHRWQIHGRKETPAPFWLANSRDGAGAAHYCLGRRDEPELRTYFDRLGGAFSSIRDLLGKKSLVAQLVAFPEPDWQLPAYLSAMEGAGFAELRPVCNDSYLFEGRIWRHVPGRKWYANQKGKIGASKEVLLLHRPSIAESSTLSLSSPGLRAGISRSSAIS